jgi:hypothetical protein
MPVAPAPAAIPRARRLVHQVDEVSHARYSGLPTRLRGV